jgi:predicted DNA-binding transcriptional regulator AlpA
MPGTLVSDKIVAATLGVGRTKVWLMAKEGTLTPTKLGNRCTRFRTDQVLALIRGEV